MSQQLRIGDDVLRVAERYGNIALEPIMGAAGVVKGWRVAINDFPWFESPTLAQALARAESHELGHEARVEALG